MVLGETSIAGKTIKLFPHENIVLNKKFNGRKPDIWFRKRETTVEVDEGNQEDNDTEDEEQRREMFNRHNFKTFHCNPNDPNFDLYKFLGEINGYIARLCEKEAANLIIDKITDDLEKVCIITKSKELKRYSKNILQITNNEKHTIKNKTNKNWKINWNNVLFWVQRFYAQPQTTRSKNVK